jgi:hypothetical protein
MNDLMSPVSIVLLLLVVIVGIELFARRYSSPAADADADNGKATDLHKGTALRNFRTLFVLHPYFGYSRRPGSTSWDVVGREPGRAERMNAPDGDDGWLSLPANSEGLFCPELPLTGSEDRYVVAILGSSVTTWLGLQSEQALKDAISGTGINDGKPVEILNLGLAGSKQPQSMAILSYVLCIGQKIDLVINIDAYNDLVFGGGNITNNLSELYPSHHILFPLKTLVSDVGWNLEGLALLVKHTRCRKMAKNAARYRATARLATMRLLALRWEQFLNARAEQMLRKSETLAYDPDTDPYIFPEGRRDAGEPFERCITVWRKASESIAAICRGCSIRYLHIVQPVMEAGAKTLTEEEQTLRQPDHPYAILLRNGYPELTAVIPEIRATGIQIEDATAMFDHVAETTYSDTWSHLNQRGNVIMTQLIADALRKYRPGER